MSMAAVKRHLDLCASKVKLFTPFIRAECGQAPMNRTLAISLHNIATARGDGKLLGTSLRLSSALNKNKVLSIAGIVVGVRWCLGTNGTCPMLCKRRKIDDCTYGFGSLWHFLIRKTSRLQEWILRDGNQCHVTAQDE
ncbi:hypothetical protein B0H34DRAFT_679485 [Crassisporium funariophilum]|nr:hypothetical protein B0H34DRAFT_679485 [Crassisporium funariophilum]